MKLIGDLSRLNARRYPHKPALVDGDSRLSYLDLDRRSNALARGLRAIGVGAGDRVALLARNCIEFALVTQAVAKCGAVLVPVNFRFAAREIAYVLEDSESKVLFLEQAYAQVAAQALALVTQPVRQVTLEPSAPGSAPATLQALCEGQAVSAVEPAITPEAPAAIMYTSGTTGFPKGVLYSHEMYFRMFTGTVVEGDFAHADVVHLAMPLFHNAGLNGALNPAMLVGATCVIHRGSFEPEAVLDEIERHRITTVVWVPTMLTILAQAARSRPRDTACLAKVFYGGMPIAPEVLAETRRMFPTASLYQVYGSTECGMVSVLRPEDHEAFSQCTGREVFNCESRIVDEQGRDVPEGGIGEIIVRQSASGMLGYWRNEAAMHETIRDGWIRTGDLARRERQGFFTVVDRKKDLIISGAENIYPKEVEAVIAAHPAVREVAVFGIPDAKYGETVCAALVLREGASLDQAGLDAFCSTRLAGYKRPRRIEFHAELPKNAAGKVVKPELRKPHWAGRTRTI